MMLNLRDPPPSSQTASMMKRWRPTRKRSTWMLLGKTAVIQECSAHRLAWTTCSLWMTWRTASCPSEPRVACQRSLPVSNLRPKIFCLSAVCPSFYHFVPASPLLCHSNLKLNLFAGFKRLSQHVMLPAAISLSCQMFGAAPPYVMRCLLRSTMGSRRMAKSTRELQVWRHSAAAEKIEEGNCRYLEL